MNVDEFQKNRLERHFAANATAEVKARREEKKMSMKGAYEWIISRVRGCVEEQTGGESLRADGRGMIIGDDEWCYAEMMDYFAHHEEGDTYKTEAEIKAEEEQQKREAKERHDKAERLWKQHAERVARWHGMTKDEIKDDIYRQKHPHLATKSKEEVAKKRAEAEAANELARKNAEEMKRKAEARAEREKKKEAKKKAEEAQMTLF